MSAEISLASRALINGGASFVWSNVRGPIVHHHRRVDPQNSPTTSDQCVFIKGFRAKRVLFRIKPLRAAAEPLPDDPDNRGDGDIHVTPVPGVPRYCDPTIGVLDYIVEKCIEGGIAGDLIAIAHDDDLHFIEDMKSLTADEIRMHLHERNMPLLVENGAAILHVPPNNAAPVSNEKQISSTSSAGPALPIYFAGVPRDDPQPFMPQLLIPGESSVQAGDDIDTRPAVADKPRVKLRRRRSNPGDGGSEVADGTLPQLGPPTGLGSTDSARKRLREEGTNDGWM